MNTATVSSGQSLFDIALQHCGAMEAAFDIALANGLSLTDELMPGQTLALPQKTYDADVAAYYSVNSIQPASAITPENLGGIDFWIVEHDFIIK